MLHAFQDLPGVVPAPRQGGKGRKRPNSGEIEREREKKKKESGNVRPRQGTAICNFRALPPLDFLTLLQWTYLLILSPGDSARKSAQNVEKIDQFPGGNCVESCRVSGCHGLYLPR